MLHADKNGEYFCEENLHNGNENGEHMCVENLHGDHLIPHKLGSSHQSPQETQHLCLPELCPSSVGPEHQQSMIYESLTGKHIKYYNAGQVPHHPSLPDGNHHMSTFPLFTKYTWIGTIFFVYIFSYHFIIPFWNFHINLMLQISIQKCIVNIHYFPLQVFNKHS